MTDILSTLVIICFEISKYFPICDLVLWKCACMCCLGNEFQGQSWFSTYYSLRNQDVPGKGLRGKMGPQGSVHFLPVCSKTCPYSPFVKTLLPSSRIQSPTLEMQLTAKACWLTCLLGVMTQSPGMGPSAKEHLPTGEQANPGMWKCYTSQIFGSWNFF